MNKKEKYIPAACIGNTKLTRQYFEKLKYWETKLDPPDDTGFQMWQAKLDINYKDIENHPSSEHAFVTNCMYPWRFAVNANIQGDGEGYIQGTVFVCTVEEFELIFKLAHCSYLLDKK